MKTGIKEEYTYKHNVTKEGWVRVYQDRMTSNVCIHRHVNAIASDVCRHSTLVNLDLFSFHAAFDTRVERCIVVFAHFGLVLFFGQNINFQSRE